MFLLCRRALYVVWVAMVISGYTRLKKRSVEKRVVLLYADLMLYFVSLPTPIGKPRVCFNAHRIQDPFAFFQEMFSWHPLRTH